MAGFDPSAGAGLLADVKTFEQLGVYGLGVCTANTMQTENQFNSIYWIPLDQVMAQLKILLENYPVAFMKVGLVESFEVLDRVLQFLKTNYPQTKVIWDPVLKASAGFTFHEGFNKSVLKSCCKKIFLITPNREEASVLTGKSDALEAANQLATDSNVFLKSYETENDRHADMLFEAGKRRTFESDLLENHSKHGSGCVLSAAITACLAQGNNLARSCELAKSYTYQFLNSTSGLLGEHKQLTIAVNHG